MFRHAVELCQAAFGKTPKRFDTVNMPLTTGKLIVTMVNPEMFIKSDIDQSVITAPSIRMNHSIWRHMSTDNGSQCCFGAVGYSLYIHFPATLKHSKDNCFAIGAPASFTSNTLGAKIGFVDLYRTWQRGFRLAVLDYARSYFKINSIDESDRNTDQLGCASNSEFQRKIPNEWPEFCFSDSKTKIISVSNIHLSKFTHFNKCLTF